MPNPKVKLIPVADWSKGTNQAPGFMRKAQGAAEEMQDLVIDLQGRPIPRKGYAPADGRHISSLGTNIGQWANTREFDQLIVLHWLGDDDTPDGAKRVYAIPHDATWAQDENGRLCFVVVPGETPKIIDVKNNTRFEWRLQRPSNAPLITINREPSDEIDDASNASIYKKISDIGIYPNPFIGEGYITVDVVETVTFDISIWGLDGKIKDLDDGEFLPDTTDSPSQGREQMNNQYEPGRYQFKWDGTNDLGERVAISPNYFPTLTVDGEVIRIDRAAFVGREAAPGLTERQTIEQFVGSLEEKAIDDGELKEGHGFRSGTYTFCYTYASSEYQMETRPSPIDDVYVYSFSDVRYRDDDDETLSRAPVKIDVEIDNELPEWADEVRIYAKRGRALRGVKEAIETGWDFDFIGKITRETGAAADTNFLWENEERGEPYDLLDSFDHDGPPDGLRGIVDYGVGLWGFTLNQVYFTKIGNYGDQRVYTFPHNNTLIPHEFPLTGSGQSPILDVHAAAHESALLAFKRDAIHIIRGKGVVSGLFEPDTVAQVDVDASGVIEGTGTQSPRTIITVGTGVYFVGSDRKLWRYGANWRGQTELDDVGLPIQKYLDELTDEEVENLVAFLYQNCYHLIMPERIIVLDMTRKYWTSFSWKMKDAFWSRGGINAESILFGLRQDGTIFRLYEGDTDFRIAIGGLWRSNPVAMPSESVITGIIAVHTDKDPPLVKCRADVDDVEGVERGYIPKASNHFRCGMHKVGSRVSVQLKADVGFPRLDRIQAEIYPR